MGGGWQRQRQKGLQQSQYLTIPSFCIISVSESLQAPYHFGILDGGNIQSITFSFNWFDNMKYVSGLTIFLWMILNMFSGMEDSGHPGFRPQLDKHHLILPKYSPILLPWADIRHIIIFAAISESLWTLLKFHYILLKCKIMFYGHKVFRCFWNIFGLPSEVCVVFTVLFYFLEFKEGMASNTLLGTLSLCTSTCHCFLIDWLIIWLFPMDCFYFV